MREKGIRDKEKLERQRSERDRGVTEKVELENKRSENIKY